MVLLLSLSSLLALEFFFFAISSARTDETLAFRARLAPIFTEHVSDAVTAGAIGRNGRAVHSAKNDHSQSDHAADDSTCNRGLDAPQIQRGNDGQRDRDHGQKGADAADQQQAAVDLLVFVPLLVFPANAFQTTHR